MNKLIQMIPTYHRYDAIGQHIRTIHRYFSSLGWDCRIMALDTDYDLTSGILHADATTVAEEGPAYWVYHYALPSAMTLLFSQAQGKRILVYHNLTPPEYFIPWNPSLAFLVRSGRLELKSLLRIVHWSVADSQFNAQELEEMGFHSVHVMPILIHPTEYPEPSSIALKQYFDPDYQHWLFVGRVVPNKKLEDLIRLFFWYQKVHHQATRLFIVGKLNNTPRYVHWLMDIRSALHLEPRAVSFLGPVSYEDLAALYKGADLFITLSDHEGFCLPIVEALHYGTPIMAYAAGAVPETLGKAGDLVFTRDPAILTERLKEFIPHGKNSPKLNQEREKQLEKLDPLPYLIQFREYLETLE